MAGSEKFGTCCSITSVTPFLSCLCAPIYEVGTGISCSAERLLDIEVMLVKCRGYLLWTVLIIKRASFLNQRQPQSEGSAGAVQGVRGVPQHQVCAVQLSTLGFVPPSGTVSGDRL